MFTVIYMVSFYLIIVILNMSSPSRKRKAITLETKYEIIQEVEKGGLPKKDVAAKFEILPNTLSTILKNITLNFLPPNTTSLLQPMDQGIINNLKIKYRQRLIKYILQVRLHLYYLLFPRVQVPVYIPGHSM